jgi:hypothetical protein
LRKDSRRPLVERWRVSRARQIAACISSLGAFGRRCLHRILLCLLDNCVVANKMQSRDLSVGMPLTWVDSPPTSGRRKQEFPQSGA